MNTNIGRVCELRQERADTLVMDFKVVLSVQGRFAEDRGF